MIPSLIIGLVVLDIILADSNKGVYKWLYIITISAIGLWGLKNWLESVTDVRDKQD